MFSSKLFIAPEARTYITSAALAKVVAGHGITDFAFAEICSDACFKACDSFRRSVPNRLAVHQLHSGLIVAELWSATEKNLTELFTALIENRSDKIDVDKQAVFFDQLGETLLDAFSADDSAERGNH